MCRPPSRRAHSLPQARAGTRALLPVSLGEAPGGRDADFGVRLPPATCSLRPGQSPWPAEGPGQGGQGGFKRESSAAWSQLQVFADAAAPGTPSKPWEGRVCRQLRGRQHRPPVLPGQLRLPGWVWAVGTPEPPAPSPGPPTSCLHSGRASESRDPDSRPARGWVTVLAAPPSGCWAGVGSSPHLPLGRVQPASEPACCSLPCIPGLACSPKFLPCWRQDVPPKVHRSGIHPLTWPVAA